MMSFALKSTAVDLFVVFSIIVVGYLIGRIRIKGIGLGTAAIFLSGLLFGHFGAHTPAVLQMAGLTLFITSIGLSAGPTFVQRLKMNGKAYVVLCLTIVLTGAAVCALVIKGSGLSASLAIGIMTGAFTTSPGFAAAKEAVSASAEAIQNVAAGYGVTYPVGVVCKVLFIQLVPKLVHADMEKERSLIALPENPDAKKGKVYEKLDTWGFLSFSIAVVLGILLGAFSISLPGGGKFALGATGGSLIVGLLIGHIGHIGKFDLRPDPRIYGPAKEIGLMFFFSGAGVEGGKGLMKILAAHGFMLWVYGFAMVALPLLVGFFVFRKILKLPLLNGLGSIAASMTCTPSLAVLIQTAGTDDVASAYATTYPIALTTLVFIVQFLAAL
jgi:putative transport protein